ncbi:MAG: hypothetical protein IAE63_06740 [Alphaproteobacteria bacterium]|nr:hypothetical protein [Alphaproteobacteria bacterium]
MLGVSRLALGVDGYGSVSVLPWYTQGKADDTDPSFWADFTNNRYAVNGNEEVFSDIFTFTRSTTGTYFDANGVMQTAAINEPRFDHDPATGEPLGLLIEEQRTNIKTDSAGNGTSYVGSNLTVTANSGIAPDGTNSATRVDFSNTAHAYRSTSTTVSASTAYAFTFYAKRGTLSDASYRVYDQTNGADIIANTSYYAQLSSTGWVRITVLFTTPLGCINVLLYLENSLSTGYMYLWGVQLEQGAFATSYIPTTSSAVTRTSDTLTANATNIIPVSSWASSIEETTYIHAQQFALSTTAPRLYEYDTNSNSSLAIVSASHVNQQYSVGGVKQAEFISTITAFEDVKAAIAAKFNDFAASVNGLTTITDNSGSFAKRVSIKFGNSTADNRPLNGHIREFRYYPIRVTNSELQRITT